MNVKIKAIDDSNLEDEVQLCKPLRESSEYSIHFEKGAKDKVQ